MYGKGLGSRIYNKPLLLSNKKTNQFKMCKGLNRHSSKEDTKMANKYMKRCSKLKLAIEQI